MEANFKLLDAASAPVTGNWFYVGGIKNDVSATIEIDGTMDIVTVDVDVSMDGITPVTAFGQDFHSANTVAASASVAPFQFIRSRFSVGTFTGTVTVKAIVL